jgi:hypothetical protein
MSGRSLRGDRAPRLQRVITKFAEQKISMLHVFGRVAKRARAAIQRNEFRARGRFGIPRLNLSALKHIQLPQLHFP